MLSNVHGLAFENATRLWERTLASNPTCWIAWQNAGAEKNAQARNARMEGNLQEGARLESEALELFEKALSFERDPNLLTTMANTKLSRYSSAPHPL